MTLDHLKVSKNINLGWLQEKMKIHDNAHAEIVKHLYAEMVEPETEATKSRVKDDKSNLINEIENIFYKKSSYEDLSWSDISLLILLYKKENPRSELSFSANKDNVALEDFFYKNFHRVINVVWQWKSSNERQDHEIWINDFLILLRSDFSYAQDIIETPSKYITVDRRALEEYIIEGAKETNQDIRNSIEKRYAHIIYFKLFLTNIDYSVDIKWGDLRKKVYSNIVSKVQKRAEAHNQNIKPEWDNEGIKEQNDPKVEKWEGIQWMDRWYKTMTPEQQSIIKNAAIRRYWRDKYKKQTFLRSHLSIGDVLLLRDSGFEICRLFLREKSTGWFIDSFSELQNIKEPLVVDFGKSKELNNGLWATDILLPKDYSLESSPIIHSINVDGISGHIWVINWKLWYYWWKEDWKDKDWDPYREIYDGSVVRIKQVNGSNREEYAEAINRKTENARKYDIEQYIKWKVLWFYNIEEKWKWLEFEPFSISSLDFLLMKQVLIETFWLWWFTFNRDKKLFYVNLKEISKLRKEKWNIETIASDGWFWKSYKSKATNCSLIARKNAEQKFWLAHPPFPRGHAWDVYRRYNWGIKNKNAWHWKIVMSTKDIAPFRDPTWWQWLPDNANVVDILLLWSSTWKNHGQEQNKKYWAWDRMVGYKHQGQWFVYDYSHKFNKKNKRGTSIRDASPIPLSTYLQYRWRKIKWVAFWNSSEVARRDISVKDYSSEKLALKNERSKIEKAMKLYAPKRIADINMMKKNYDIFSEYVYQASKKTWIEKALIYAIMWQESTFKLKDKPSSAWAVWLMQLMRDAAIDTKVNRHDQRENVLGGAKYIKMRIKSHKWNLIQALQGYNGGSGNVFKGTVSSDAKKYANEVLSKYNILSQLGV